ncbi:hypothetical protein ACFFMS_19900 [Ectobacillus funiculus]|uniref:Uncharacterized protein n=1 Tax=Ectobacillus funiculus TaxID=137993 RepID=A0ABV5WIY7_9BACI
MFGFKDPSFLFQNIKLFLFYLKLLVKAYIGVGDKKLYSFICESKVEKGNIALL